jgi:hypothetical protein
MNFGVHLGCGAERRVVEHGHVLVDRAARRFRRQAPRSVNAALAVGVGLDQAGIDCETVAADQPLGHAAAHDGLEDVAQQVAVAEAAVAVLGEGRVIGHGALQAEPAEPSVGQV